MLHHDAAFILIKYSNITQQSMIQLQLEILSEPDTNPFECTSSDVEKAYPTLNLHSLCVLQCCINRANCKIVNVFLFFIKLKWPGIILLFGF